MLSEISSTPIHTGTLTEVEWKIFDKLFIVIAKKGKQRRREGREGDGK